MDTIDYGAQPDLERVARARAADSAAAREAMAGQRAAAGMGNPPGGPIPAPEPAGPSVYRATMDRANAGLKSMLPSVADKSVGGMLRMAGRAAPGVIGAGLEAADVAKVASDPNATVIDVATQASEGVGKLGAAGVGAGMGAAVGGPVGAVLGGVAGYLGGEKLIQAGRSLVGVDPASPAERARVGELPAPRSANGLSEPGQRGTVGPGGPVKPAPRSQDVSYLANVPAAPVVPTNPTTMTTGDMAAPGGRVSVIPAASGGGYGGPSFNAAQLRAPGDGPVGPSAGVSAALKAAADRGDTDAIAAHYQRNGGTFNGTTAAQDQAAAYERAAMYAPSGSKRQAALIGGADRATARQAQNVASAAARAKAATDAYETQAKVGEIGARTAKAQAEAAKEQNLNAMLRQLSSLDEKSDPGGKQRESLMERILASQGKEPGSKFQPIDIDTGTPNPITGAPTVVKGAVNNRTGQVIGGPKAPVVVSRDQVKRAMKETGMSEKDQIAYFKAHGAKIGFSE